MDLTINGAELVKWTFILGVATGVSLSNILNRLLEVLDNG